MPRALRAAAPAAVILVASLLVGCQIMVTDLAARGEVILDCTLPDPVPARDGFHCLASPAGGVAAGYYGAEVEALWGPWNGAEYGFCLTFGSDGGGHATALGDDGTVVTAPLRWGIVVDPWGWVERTPAGYWPLYLETSLEAVPHLLFWRSTTWAFPRYPLAARGPCPLG